jgi:hypothetical protein
MLSQHALGMGCAPRRIDPYRQAVVRCVMLAVARLPAEARADPSLGEGHSRSRTIDSGVTSDVGPGCRNSVSGIESALTHWVRIEYTARIGLTERVVEAKTQPPYDAQRGCFAMIQRDRALSAILGSLFVALGVACDVHVPSGVYACMSQADCPHGLYCSEISQTCVSALDESVSASGSGGSNGDAGVPGSSGAAAGGSSTHPGSGTAGGAGRARNPAGSGGRGDVAGGGGAPNAGAGPVAGNPAGGGGGAAGGGDSCGSDGTLRCAAAGGAARETCTGGRWSAAPDCPSGQICSAPSSGPVACIAVSDLCRGSEGSAICDAQGKLSICNPDGSLGVSTQCKSARHCQAGIAAKACPTCLASQEYHCEVATLQLCAADGNSFQMKTDCGTAALCNESAGMCTASVCASGQFSCQGNTLATCNSDGSAYATMLACGTKTCDAAGGDCNLCEPGQKTCDSTSPSGVLTCNATGQGYDQSTCSGTMRCAGAGQCVECIADADCGTGKQCRNSKCACMPQCTGKQCGPDGCGGTCGSACGFGTMCDSTGTCVCAPSCFAKNCGSDGCNGSCGTCSAGQGCNAFGTCATSCGNGTVDATESCDDMNVITTDACINCQKATCGDGYVESGIEQCDPSAAEWAGKCDVTCKRTIYLPCPNGETDCATSTHCATLSDPARKFCSHECTVATDCPVVPGFTSVCNMAYCMVTCNNNACPLGMACVANLPLIDVTTNTETTISACDIAP